MKSKRFYIIGFALALVAWFVFGTLIRPAIEEGDKAAPARRLMGVKVERTISVPLTATVSIFGETRAVDRFEIKSRLAGTLEEKVKNKGMAVKKGDVIIRMGQEDRESVFRRAKVEFDTAKTLFDEGLISRVEFMNAKAVYERAKQDMEHTNIRAPFDGIVGPIYFSSGEYIPANTAIGLVVKLDEVKVVAEVPERHISRLKLNKYAEVKIPGHKPFDAPIVYIAPTANAATRTFPIELRIKNPGYVVDGMTAEVMIPLDTVNASLLSTSSSLTFNEAGTVGLKVVNADDVVEFYPIELVKEDSDGLWISGLPSPARVIVSGQEFVKVGEKVSPQGD